VATVEVAGFKLIVLMIVDKYESPNAVYQSEGHPIFTILLLF